jgi:hypothetical protein
MYRFIIGMAASQLQPQPPDPQPHAPEPAPEELLDEPFDLAGALNTESCSVLRLLEQWGQATACSWDGWRALVEPAA